jgi:hypothetical protein
MAEFEYQNGMDYGVGIDDLTGESRGSALEVGPIREMEDAAGQTVWANVDLIQSSEDLSSALGVDAALSSDSGFLE